MARATHFEELDCWKLADELKRKVLSIGMQPGAADESRVVGQLRAAARSAPNTIAEGFGRRRRSHRDFARYLHIARGSLVECQNRLRDAVDSGHITRAEFDALVALARRAGDATAALQRYVRRNPDP